MGEDTVFSLERPGQIVEDDPLLCLLLETATLARPLHADFGLMAQTGRTFLRPAHRTRPQAPRVSLTPRTRTRNRRPYPGYERGSQAVPPDQDRRRDPCEHPTLLLAHTRGKQMKCNGIRNQDLLAPTPLSTSMPTWSTAKAANVLRITAMRRDNPDRDRANRDAAVRGFATARRLQYQGNAANKLG